MNDDLWDGVRGLGSETWKGHKCVLLFGRRNLLNVGKSLTWNLFPQRLLKYCYMSVYLVKVLDSTTLSSHHGDEFRVFSKLEADP